MAVRNKKRKERTKFRFLNGKYNKHTMSIGTKFSLGVLVSIAVIVVAYFYPKYIVEHRLENTLAGLLRQEKEAAVSDGIRIAVGFGSCQDLIVQSNQVVFDPPPAIPEPFDSITTKEEFLKVFAYYYRHGAAAERYISNSTLFGELVQEAEKASTARYFIGSNAPLMAQRFMKEGAHVLLGAQMSRSLQSQFPEQMIISGPIIKQDNVHLLLEYPAGQKWGEFIPPRANRFIIHNDHQNPKLSSLDSFVKQLQNYSPNLLVIGGLQMMDNFPMSQDQQMEHLIRVQNLMRSQPPQVRIHFEMASFIDRDLLKGLVENVIPYADSLGMNEQELPNLYHMMKYGNISLVSDSYPRVAVILDQMRDMFQLMQDTAEIGGRRRLTRLHVHTLAFQAFMLQKQSPWRNTRAAAAKSALTAHRHTCGSEAIDPKTARLIMDESFATSVKAGSRRVYVDSGHPVSCWDEGRYQLCVAPVLVCTKVLQTGGGGDNISSAGLVLQV